MQTEEKVSSSRLRGESLEGKTFDRLSEKWVYKTTIGTRLHWFCSWKCLRAATNPNRQPAAAHA